MVKNYEKFDFFGNVEIFQKISQNFDYGQIVNKNSILVKIFENFGIFRFWLNFRKKIRFWSKFSKISNISIFVKFAKKIDFGHNFRNLSIFFRKLSNLLKFSKKLQFWSKFSKISIFSKIFKKNRKISIYVQISRKKFDFGQTGRKFSTFWKISKKFDFIWIFEKISILVDIFEEIRFFRKFRKISILVILSENFDFGHNFRKNSIFPKISTLLKFSKKFDFGQNFEKIDFGPIV